MKRTGAASFFLPVLLCVFLAACTARVPQPDVADNGLFPPQFPEAFYRQAQADGKTVLHIDPHRSLVTIEVRRGGPLARMGHDHVVAVHDLRGYVLVDDGRADLSFALANLAVDEPALRAEAGMDTIPSADAIEGTRRNMLEKVLDVQQFPFAQMHVERAGASNTLNLTLTLHGNSRRFSVPTTIETSAQEMTASGRLSLTQSDFGITPYSILGGALQVQDTLDLRYRIVARR